MTPSRHPYIRLLFIDSIPGLPSVLFLADVLHPIHNPPASTLLNRDVGHCSGRRGTMPMPLSGRKPDNIAGVNLLNRTALPLDPPASRRDNQCLAEGMRMPRRSRSWLKRDAGARNSRRFRSLEERVNANRTGKPVRRAFAGGLRSIALDIHDTILMLKIWEECIVSRVSIQSPSMDGLWIQPRWADGRRFFSGGCDHLQQLF